MNPVPWDLNCDLGEGEPFLQTAALMAVIDSANIACGAHAGDDAGMRRCLELAGRLGVHAGAHPGFPDRASFGRATSSPGPLTTESLAELLEPQVGRLMQHARELGVPLHHVKLHGALYHAVEGDPALARSYLGIVAANWPGMTVYARTGGHVVAAGRDSGFPVWSEAFLDRGYRNDGTLVPRSEPGAVLHSAPAVLQRLRDLRAGGRCRSVEGAWIELSARTWCIHGDSPDAVALLRAVRNELHGPS